MLVPDKKPPVVLARLGRWLALGKTDVSQVSRVECCWSGGRRLCAACVGGHCKPIKHLAPSRVQFIWHLTPGTRPVACILQDHGGAGQRSWNAAPPLQVPDLMQAVQREMQTLGHFAYADTGTIATYWARAFVRHWGSDQ